MRKVIAILASLLVVLTAGATVVLLRRPNQEEAIKEAVVEAGYCAVASDCAVVYAPCPFGCHAGVNRSEASRIEAMMGGYQSNCAYMCIAHQGVGCVNSRCMVNNGREEQTIPESYYEDDSLGIGFTYRSDVGGYALRLADGGDVQRRVVLLRKSALGEQPPNSEGPPSISISAYDAGGAATAREWLDAHPEVAGPFRVSPEAASIGGVLGLRWGSDGLYASDNAIVIRGNRAIVFTVGWADAASTMRNDFARILDTVRYLPSQ